ncbi:MAG: SARP family transcriptional regulator, partial [Eggerthellaceae bacterium]|nr:SARP family transcriptional regulator [Eggerthellaceae bacterium]
MKDFIALAACKGRSPVRISRTPRPRPHLMNRLLCDRHALRIVCAPDGFGKTTLLYEYADTMFGFEGVFWLDGASPCFLRDLDDGRLA